MGYTYTANAVGRFTTNTEFRNWGAPIANAIANCGLVQTADTGQIDWATVAAPNNSYTMSGYEIYRFNDALQNTAPVYLKIEYGSGAGGQTSPTMRVTLGSGSAGNGTLMGFPSKDGTGATGNAWVIMNGGAFANSTLVSYICGDTNRLAVAHGVRGTGSSASYGFFFSLERTVDANGTPTPYGVMFTWRAAYTHTFGQMVWSPKIGWIGSEIDTWGILVPQYGATIGSNTGVYPVFHNWGGGAFLNPGLNILMYHHNEFTAGTSNTFTYYGNSRTYMPLGNTTMYGMDPRANNSVCAMMRWD